MRPSGALTFVGVIRQADDVEAVGGLSAIAVSGDDRHVHATSAANSSVAVFRRDPTTDALALDSVTEDFLAAAPVSVVVADGRCMSGPARLSSHSSVRRARDCSAHLRFSRMVRALWRCNPGKPRMVVTCMAAGVGALWHTA
jgi:hypothetical protein